MLTTFRMGNAGRVATQYMKMRHTPQPFKAAWPAKASSPIDTSVPILGIFPEPQPCTGPELLQALTGVSRPYARKQYRMMSQDDQWKLRDTDGLHHGHRHRIWRGYEVVEWRKRHEEICDGPDFDPYINTGLYPWEIIKDKLRKCRQLSLSSDCYDYYICQALHSKLLRTPFDIYYTDHRLNINGTSRKVAEKMFWKLGNAEMKLIESATKRNNQHILWSTKVGAANHEFQEFYKRNVNYNDQRPLYEVVKAWEAATVNSHAGDQDLNPRHSTQANEIKLDLQSAIVLDYMYYAGTVEGAPLNYSWAQDMRERVGGLVYLAGGGYTNLSLYTPIMK